MSRYEDSASGGLVSKSLPEHLTLASVIQEEEEQQHPNSILRKRHIWHEADADSYSDSEDDSDDLSDDDDLAEEDDAIGCPLPSTPEDHQLLEEEVR